MKMNDSGNIFTQFFAWVGTFAAALGFTTQDVVYMFFGAVGLHGVIQVSEEQSEQWTWEGVQVLLCFYGPGGSAMATRFRDGIFIEQNSDTFRRISGLSLVDAGDIRNLPELINNQWVRRYDVTVTLSRKNTRTYNVKSIVGPNVTIVTGD